MEGDVVVTEIGRQRQHVPVGAVAVGGDGVLERAHGEAMTEIVQPRARLAGSATKTDLACKLDEHAGHDIGVDWSTGREDEQVLACPAATLSDREVPAEGINGAAKKRNEPRFLELCLPHDQSVRGDVGQAQCAYFAAPQSGGGHQSDDVVPGVGA